MRVAFITTQGATTLVFSLRKNCYHKHKNNQPK